MPLDILVRDLRYAWRNAVRRPTFTLLVVSTLALGIGVNSAVFALVDAALIRPLPYQDPGRLVYVWQTLPKHNVFEVEATPFDYDAWHALKSLSGLAMISYGSFSLTGGTSDAERVRGARVTASLMPLLGIEPAVGRGFLPAEDGDESSAVVILSDGLWRRRYGADPTIVGRTIDVDGSPSLVVGIMPRHAQLPDTIGGEGRDLWLPMRLTPSERVNEISHNYTVVGRLADAVPLEQASAELDAFVARMAAERRPSSEMGARLMLFAERRVRAVRPALLVAMAGVALLLLVATANASTLLIARAANRRGELAVRAALGASGRRLLSLSIAEGLLLAAIGGLLGAVLGRWTLRALIPLFAASLPHDLTIDTGPRAVVFIAGLAGILGLVFGVVVAYRPGDRLADSLGNSARSTATASVGRARNVLVIAQTTLAVVLLSAAGLMLNSVAKLARVNPGFVADHLLTFRITLTGERYATAPARLGTISDILERIGTLPGVRSASLVSVVPFGGLRNASVVQIEGRTPAPGEPSMIIDQRHVSPGYFRTMGIALVSGRMLTDRDVEGTERVVLVNRTMARRRFPNENPLNRRVRLAGGFDSGVWFRIVGVVDDVRHLALNRDPIEEMYRPIAQTAVPTVAIVARTIGDPATMAPAARAAVRAVDRNLPMYELRTMDDRIASSFAQTRAAMLVLLLTAVLAAALAAVAIYGSIWYSVSLRTAEIGIRLALGATRASVFGSIVGRALLLAAIGATLGTAGAAAARPLLAGFLFEAPRVDLTAHGGVLAVILLVTLAASAGPARRATRIDPIAALRAE